jgi:RHS repeat-associated protein
VVYTRGNDLSGSLEGAGGIGGLLARSSGYSGSTGNWSTHDYYHADGNGNITCLVDTSQTLAASYRYDPYGNLISSSGALASTNTCRFSSKEYIPSAGLYYYLYRFYDPNLQRWVNRDPIDEEGGLNLYAFPNDPVDFVDIDGLSWWPKSWPVFKGFSPPPPSYVKQCTNPQDIARCYNICLTQGKAMAACLVVSKTIKGPLGFWYNSTSYPCVCADYVCNPFRKHFVP